MGRMCYNQRLWTLIGISLLVAVASFGCSIFPSKQPSGLTPSMGTSGAFSRPSNNLNPGIAQKSGVVAANGSFHSGSGQLDPLTSVKDGLEKVGELLTFTEPVQQAPDPTALSTRANPSPRLYVAMARLAEESNQLTTAEDYYGKALNMDATHLEALLGLGRLKDRQGQLDEALSYYQKAVKAHPGEATAWNHLGLCYARMNKFMDAKTALEKAVKLSPKEARYRHNLATVLVQLGDLQSALQELQNVHDEATACYNLGYLLVKKGDRAAASRYFSRAVQLKPEFQEARQWLEAVSKQPVSQTNENTNIGPSTTVSTGLPSSAIVQGKALPLPGRPSESPPPLPLVPQTSHASKQVAPLPPITEEETIEISDKPGPQPIRPLPPVYE